MLIVGDVHGKVDQFWELCLNHWGDRPADQIIQLGDVGFKTSYDKLIKLYKSSHKHRGKLTIVPGNHDDYSRYYPVVNSASWKYTGGIKMHDWNSWAVNSGEELTDFFSLRGANSIDKHFRTEGKDWFVTEELSYSQLGKAVDNYIHESPKVMFSHTCPSLVKKQLFGYSESSRTEQALQVMFEKHQPEYWFFGHFHFHRDEVINGTRFICLAELQTYELDL
jgi:predicted phosphodiesterase